MHSDLTMTLSTDEVIDVNFFFSNIFIKKSIVSDIVSLQHKIKYRSLSDKMTQIPYEICMMISLQGIILTLLVYSTNTNSIIL